MRGPVCGLLVLILLALLMLPAVICCFLGGWLMLIGAASLAGWLLLGCWTLAAASEHSEHRQEQYF